MSRRQDTHDVYDTIQRVDTKIDPQPPKRAMSKGLVAAFVILLIAFIVFLNNAPQPNPTIRPPPIDSPEGKYMKGAVAADNVMCSEIGRNILLKGGNAVDAAIAALSCIGIMDTHSTGMGGGHIMTIYNASLPTQPCTIVDARHAAPLKASKNMFGNDSWPSEQGWLAIAVPGELAGMWKEYKKFGSGNVKWKDLIQPTVDLLKNGYPVTHELQAAFDQKKYLLWNETTMRWAFKKYNASSYDDSQVWQAGDLLNSRTTFADFTQMVADCEDGCDHGTNPHDLFYAGTYAGKMAAEFKTRGGIITTDDFTNYEAIVRTGDQVIYSYHKNGRAICGPPPPGSGAVVQSILGILDNFDYPDNHTFDQEVEHLHRFIEASKFAFAARLGLGDIGYVNTSLPLAKTIASGAWTSATAKKITNNTHPDSYYAYPGLEKFTMRDVKGTTHISVMDQWGNAVAVTSTINLFFGAKVASESTGVLWNDEMNDFSLPRLSDYFGFIASPANFIEPGKRPMSATSPIVVFNSNGGNADDNNHLSVFGAAGGSTIISSTAGVAWHNLWLKDGVKSAMDFPRLHNQYQPNNTQYEDRLPDAYVQALRARGHNMTITDYLSTATAINKPSVKGQNETYGTQRYNIYANSDFRKGVESAPGGY